MKTDYSTGSSIMEAEGKSPIQKARRRVYDEKSPEDLTTDKRGLELLQQWYGTETRDIAYSHLREDMEFFGFAERGIKRAIKVLRISDEIPEDDLDFIIRKLKAQEQQEQKIIISLEGRLDHLGEDISTITLFEYGNANKYTGIQSDWFLEAGIKEGDYFILNALDNNGSIEPIVVAHEEKRKKLFEDISQMEEEFDIKGQQDLDDLLEMIGIDG